jgi:hypothetical protein
MNFIVKIVGYTIGGYVFIVLMFASQTFLCLTFAHPQPNQLCPMLMRTTRPMPPGITR